MNSTAEAKDYFRNDQHPTSAPRRNEFRRTDDQGRREMTTPTPGGRKCAVTFPDQNRLELYIPPGLTAAELLHLAASQVGLREKQYFALATVDEQHQCYWLSPEKRVLDQLALHSDLKTSHEIPNIHLLVKFYVESISQLRDPVAVELFYFHAKRLISQGTGRSRRPSSPSACPPSPRERLTGPFRDSWRLECNKGFVLKGPLQTSDI
ncbi:unnamed protein product [Cyprideis torosa]|uniref:Uncharacterized protein n=1 Tax=Cyprideis torosa TaxID=163714 RepID=A0A7R8W6X5_9CRUS|nr:unnamed protein product [Cyprideis torosa]CAG0881765.1 unnamed protein product [Cyprideis torosa]